MTVLEMVQRRCGDDADTVARILGLVDTPERVVVPAPTINAERNRRYRARKKENHE